MDPSPDQPGAFAGWADRLAAYLAAHNAQAGAEFGYANLAIRGRLIADVAGPQVDAALELTPDLVSFCAGGNDCLRAKVSIDDVVDQLEDAVIRIKETGADVLLVTSPNVSESPIVGRVNPRMAEFTAGLWGVASRHECYVLDLWNLRPLRDPRMWAEDRIHFSPEGHARIAAQAAYTLGVSEDAESWREPLPAASPLSRWESLAADREWARTHLRPWIVRRIRGQSSGDGIAPKRPRIAPLTLEPEQGGERERGGEREQGDGHEPGGSTRPGPSAPA